MYLHTFKFCYYVIISKINLYQFNIKPLLCARTRTRACAAIFVQKGVAKFSEMCVRVRAYIIFKVQTCARTSARPFLAKKFFFSDFFGKNLWVRVRAQKLGCGCMRRTLRKCVRCACGCGRKSAHTKGL